MPGKIDDPVWVDVLTGNAYRLAASNVTEVGGNSVYRVPVYDSPAFVTDRRVLDLERSEYAELLAELREFASAAVFGVMRGFFEANAFASLFDVVRPECRASSVGFLNVAAGLIGSLAPIFLGMLSDRFGVRGYEIGFACLGGVLALAAVALAASFFFTFRRDRLGG